MEEKQTTKKHIMKKILQSLVFMVLLAAPWTANAQSDTLTVCNGSNNSTHAPWYPYWTDIAYQTEFIYPASMLADLAGASITSMSFYTNLSSANYASLGDGNTKVYLSEISQTSVPIGGEWLVPTDGTLVYEGSVSIVNGVHTIEFDTPFLYTGDGNLAIHYTFQRGGTYGTTTHYFVGINNASTSGAFGSNSTSNTPGTATNYLPKCTFTYTLGSASLCRLVRNLTASEVLADEATFTWNTRNNENAWVIYLNGEEVETVYDSTYTLTDLSANTSYAFSVRALCAPGDTSNKSTVNIRTTCALLTQSDLPYEETFDNWATGSTSAIDPCWNRFNTYSTSSNYPYTYSSTHHGTTGNSLYFYSSGDTYNCLVLPPVDDLNGLLLTFWTYMGTPNNSQFQVGTMTDPNNINTFTTIFSTPANLTSNTWIEHEALVPAGTTDHYLAIRTNNTGYVTTYIDDITLMVAPSCFHPASVTVSDITENTADIIVNDPAEILNYTYYVRQGTTVVDSGDFYSYTYTLTGLAASSPYTVSVYSNCGDGTRTTPVTASFNTSCAAISTLPWTETFESYSTTTNQVQLNCWDNVNSSNSSCYTLIVSDASRVHQGQRSLRFNGYAATPLMVVLPPFSTDISELELTFWALAENNSSAGNLRVGYVTVPTDSTTFIQTAFIDANNHTTYAQTDVTFAGAPQGARIAIQQVQSSSGNYWWWIDDLDVHEAPSCLRPTSVTVRDVSNTSATVGILDASDAGHYMLYINNDSVELYDTTYTFSDLSASTLYNIRVVTVCDDGTHTASVSATFLTLCDVITVLPWHETFQSYTAEAGAGQSSSITNIPCWDVYQTYDHYSFVQSTWNHEEGGANAIRIYAGTTYPTYMVLPPFEEDLENLMFTFWSNFDNSTLRMVVGYMTDGSQTSTFVPLDTVWSHTNLNEWVYNELVFPTGATGRIAYRFYGSGTSNVRLDDYTVMLAPSCMRPQGLTVSNLTESSADITIVDPSESGNYHYTLMTGATAIDSGDISSTTFALTDLNPSTTYTVSVYSVCSDGTQTMSNTTTFTTDCGAITTLPWTEGFESLTYDQIPFCWSHLSSTNSTSSNYLRVYNSTAHTGSQCLRFNYSQSTGSVILLPPFADDINGLEMTFWHRPESYSNNLCGTFEAGYVTNATDPSTFVAVASWAYNSFTGNTYRQEEVTFGNAPEGARIAFRHEATGNNWYWHVDDIDVHVAPSCTRPILAITDITSSSATISLADNNNVNHYMIYFGNDSIEVSDTTYTFTGLNASSAYTINAVTICDDGTHTNPGTLAFSTPCASLTTLPYTCDFETYVGNNNPMPNCWTRGSASDSNPYVISNPGNAHNSTHFLYIYGSGVTAALPPVDSDSIDLATTQLSFWAKNAGTATALQVGVMSDPSNGNTFHMLGTVTVTGSNSHDLYEVLLDGYEPSMGVHVAFRGVTAANIYVDDLTLGPIPSCTRPLVSQVDLTDSTAILALSDANDVNRYLVIVGNTSTEVNDTLYEMTNLTSNTQYSVRVATLCVEGDTTDFVTYNFRTPCALIRPADLPITENFQSYPSGTQEIPCWTRHTNYGTYPQTSVYNTMSDDGMAGGLVYYMFHYSSAGAFLVTPPFESLDNLQVSCYSRTVTTGATMTIGVMTDVTDTNTFVPMYSFVPGSSWQYGETILDPDSIGNARYVAFRCTLPSTSNTGGLYLDAIRIGMPPACPRPQNVAVSNVVEQNGGVTATVTWSNPGTSTNFRVYYTTGNTTDSVDVSATTVTLTGLAAASSYSVTVAVLCEDGGMSDPSLPATFNTPCVGAISNMPWTETFNGCTGSDQNTDGEVPACWDTYSYETGAGFYPHVVTYSGSTSTYGYSPDQSQSLFLKASGIDGMAIAILPPFAYSLDDLKLKFWYRYEDANTGELTVGYVTGSNLPTDFVPVATMTGVSGNGSIDSVTFNNTPAGARMAFRWVKNATGVWYSLCIDNVTVSLTDTTVTPQPPTTYTVSATTADATMGAATVTPSGTVNAGTSVTFTATANTGYHFVAWTANGQQVSTANPYTTAVNANLSLTATFEADNVPQTCDAPTAVSVSGITQTGATVSWTAGGSENQWEIEYTAQGSTAQTATATANPYTLNGLQPGTQYSVKVRALCDASAGLQSDWSAAQTFTTLEADPQTTYYTLTVDYDQTQGTVLGAGTYEEGTPVTLTAQGLPGYRFERWSDQVTDSVRTVVLTSDLTLTAYFTVVIGIDEVAYSAVTLYPNPATTQVTLEGLENAVRVEVLDLQGRVREAQRVDGHRMALDLSGYAQGTYFVRITGAEGTAVRKLVVR